MDKLEDGKTKVVVVDSSLANQSLSLNSGEVLKVNYDKNCDDQEENYDNYDKDYEEYYDANQSLSLNSGEVLKVEKI